MSRVVIVLGLVVALAECFAIPVNAQTTETLSHFDQGNAYYASGEYQRAIDAYNSALESGYTSAQLYYNIGNAYYRIDELGRAMLAYKRAAVLSPENRELNHSIVLTSGRLVDNFSRLPEPFWVTLSQRIFSRTRVTPLTLFGLLLYVLGMALIGYQMWSQQRSPWIRRGYTLLLLIGLPLLLGGLLTSYKVAQQREAVVLSDVATLFQEPTEDSESELDVHEGLVVTVTREADNWVQITLPNGISGWVFAETIETI